MRNLSGAVTAALLAVLLMPGPVVAAPSPSLEAVRHLTDTGRYEEALSEIDRILSVNPDDAQARFLKGVVLVELGKTDAAVDVFLRLTRDFPKLPEPYNNLAVLYAANGEYVKARDALLVAIGTHPSYATAHENLGDIYTKMAGVAYDKALELDRGNETAREKLALVHELFSLANSSAGGGSTTVASRQTKQAPVVEGRSQTADPELSVELMSFVDRWAHAWSTKDVTGYLDFYAREFEPEDGRSRRHWALLRKKRIEKPKFIQVQVSEARVEKLDNVTARVTFVQSYRSDTYEDRVSKALTLVRAGSLWKIVSERTAN